MPRKPEPDPDWILDQRRQLGERVRAQRERGNFTQERLAHASGVRRLTLQNIESGATDARIGWLIRISDTLGIHVRDLLD